MKKCSALGLAVFTLVLTSSVHADGYSSDSSSTTYTSQMPLPINTQPGYTVQPPPPVTTTTQSHRHHEHKDRNRLDISFNVNTTEPVVPAPIVTIEKHAKRHHHHADDIEWITIDQGDRLPRSIVTGGYQSNPPATLYICRAPYRGGAHPGKLYKGGCNFGWGGSEVILSSGYEVLTSKYPLRWVAASYGSIPHRAIEGGYQHDGRLYICQARYRGGMHPGKVYKDSCLIGWGGQEVAIPEYYVLTR